MNSPLGAGPGEARKHSGQSDRGLRHQWTPWGSRLGTTGLGPVTHPAELSPLHTPHRRPHQMVPADTLPAERGDWRASHGPWCVSGAQQAAAVDATVRSPSPPPVPTAHGSAREAKLLCARLRCSVGSQTRSPPCPAPCCGQAHAPQRAASRGGRGALHPAPDPKPGLGSGPTPTAWDTVPRRVWRSGVQTGPNQTSRASQELTGQVACSGWRGRPCSSPVLAPGPEQATRRPPALLRPRNVPVRGGDAVILGGASAVAVPGAGEGVATAARPGASRAVPGSVPPGLGQLTAPCPHRLAVVVVRACRCPPNPEENSPWLAGFCQAPSQRGAASGHTAHPQVKERSKGGRVPPPTPSGTRKAALRRKRRNWP